jgi:general secretion pathway protein J
MNARVPGALTLSRGERELKAAGFTLLEVLLAMAITALVAVMAYSGLSTAITAAQRHGEQARRLGDLQTAISWITRDLRESVDRVIATGDETEPAMWGGESPVLNRKFNGEDRDNLLVLTRVGWDNPRGLRRGAIQRVRYRLDADNNLWRDHWLVLDRLDDDDHKQSVKLIAGIKSVTVQFLDGVSGNSLTSELGGEWVPRWPMTKNDVALPLAVQIDLDVDGIGTITRIVGLANEPTH